MVRINLLPQKKAARRAGPGNQVLVRSVVAVVVLEVLGLLFFHKSKDEELERIRRENAATKASIDDVKNQTQAHDEVRAQLKILRDREEAIGKLQSARTGPTATLLEISRILSPGGGPTTDNDRLQQLKRDNPSAVPNPMWDPKRLWLTQFVEQARSVRIAGLARDGEDVSEFLRRLNLSDFFKEVRLLPATRTMDTATRTEVVKFELSAKVKY